MKKVSLESPTAPSDFALGDLAKVKVKVTQTLKA